MAAPPRQHPSTHADALGDFLARHERLFVLTGAGVSTASGIPDYRDRDGSWKRPAPMTIQQFMATEFARKRYWARSMIGWQNMTEARPNAAHRALAELERRGQVELLVTQNVDGLHQGAGSHRVIDLHGRLDRVICLNCGDLLPREDMQGWMRQANADWLHLSAKQAPDGDVYLEDADFSQFEVPPCPVCGGILKPDVVYFGEGVPRDRVDEANAALQQADAMLVAGSSLMVYSGYRFAVQADRRGLPIAAINHGHNRADPLLTLKLDAEVGATLQAVVSAS